MVGVLLPIRFSGPQSVSLTLSLTHSGRYHNIFLFRMVSYCGGGGSGSAAAALFYCRVKTGFVAAAAMASSSLEAFVSSQSGPLRADNQLSCGTSNCQGISSRASDKRKTNEVCSLIMTFVPRALSLLRSTASDLDFSSGEKIDTVNTSRIPTVTLAN